LLDPNFLPDPLPPLEIDTSMIRALLEPRTPLTVEEFELEALAPLAPPSVIDSDDTPPSVFDLAFEDSPEVGVPEVGIEVEPAIIAEVPGIDLPEFGGTPIDIFDDLGLTNEISLDEVPTVDELPEGSVFELDEAALWATEADADEEADDQVSEGFAAPPIDVFDLNASSDAIESERIDALGPELYRLQDGPEEDSSFDSVATADAIEGELSALSDLTGLDADLPDPDDVSSVDGLLNLDNVIPIRPETGDDADVASGEPAGARPVVGGPSAARVSNTGWVGLEKASPPPVEEQPEEDPWAYMRPTEEPRSGGIWAKIFGGEERKIAKAKRRAKATDETSQSTEPTRTSEDAPDASFDSACPNCGGQCQVDLDDPIGQRVHVSCPECDHMWFTPYIIDSQTG
jgi:hypothetical protein